jgi:4'-phosphopantetheinyl transferase
MSLASALLKRAYIARSTSLPWTSIKFARKLDSKLGKPYWAAPPHEPRAGHPNKLWPKIDFNVSHQNGLVVFVGVCHYGDDDDVQISVDIVSPNERNDLTNIATSDFATFVSTYDVMFSESELFLLAYTLPEKASIQQLSGASVPVARLGRLDRSIVCGQTLSISSPGGGIETILSDLIIEEKLRTFYAAFSLKEAFLKLGGEGLAADWIQDCEFQGVRAPGKGGVPRCNLAGVWGGKITGGGRDDSDSSHDEELELSLRGKEVKDVRMELQSYEEDYLICTMTRPASILGPGAVFPEWQRINLERDIWDLAARLGN